ncbi:MAG: metallophosphoesterase [Pseudomonadota bacterium]
MSVARGRHNHWWRRAAQATLDLLLLNGAIARLSYRCGLHGALSVTEHSVTLAGPRLARPLKIAFASDFHAGPSTDPAIFACLFAELERQAPDLLLLGGDFVNSRAGALAQLVDGIARCQAPLGKFAVLGNHDLWSDEDHLRRGLAGAGVQVLVNRNCALPAPFEALSVCGMDDPWTGQADGAATFAGAGPIRILLMHAPDGLLLLGAEKFDVGFAGHTHGGQVARRDGRPIVVPHGPLSRQYCYGHYALADKGSLVVSRGVGCSTLPLRINADPELVLCTLY